MPRKVRRRGYDDDDSELDDWLRRMLSFVRPSEVCYGFWVMYEY